MKREATQPLAQGEIVQIAEFGNNPIKLFDKLHKQYKGKVNRSLVDDIESECPSRYQAEIMNNQKMEANTLLLLSSDKNIVYCITEQEICKLTIVNSKCKLQSKLKLCKQYQIAANSSFLICPRSLFGYGNDYIATCGNSEKTFILYNLKSFTRHQSLAFHLVMVY